VTFFSFYKIIVFLFDKTNVQKATTIFSRFCR
jgi:hypothetical protein